MVVRHDDASGIREQYTPEDISRLDNAGIERSAAHFVNAKQSILRVHEQKDTNLDGFVLETLTNDRKCLGGSAKVR
jgi:hypothetical protein